MSETTELLSWKNGKWLIGNRWSCICLHLQGSEQNSALLTLTRWNKPGLHPPAGSDIHPSASLQPAVVRFYLHGNDPVARAGVKGYLLWRESGPWMPVLYCSFLGVCFCRIYMCRSFLDPCSPTGNRRRLLQLNLETLPPARSHTSDSISVFSCQSPHKANPPLERFAHLSLLPFQIAVGSFWKE